MNLRLDPESFELLHQVAEAAGESLSATARVAISDWLVGYGTGERRQADPEVPKWTEPIDVERAGARVRESVEWWAQAAAEQLRLEEDDDQANDEHEDEERRPRSDRGRGRGGRRGGGRS
jgi:hypothetical protein